MVKGNQGYPYPDFQKRKKRKEVASTGLPKRKERKKSPRKGGRISFCSKGEDGGAGRASGKKENKKKKALRFQLRERAFTIVGQQKVFIDLEEKGGSPRFLLEKGEGRTLNFGGKVKERGGGEGAATSGWKERKKESVVLN